MTDFSVDVDEYAEFVDSADMRFTVTNWTFGEEIVVSWVEGGLGVAWGLSLSGASTLNFSSGGASYVWIAGAAVNEALGVSGSLGVNQVLKHILADEFGLTDAFVIGRPVEISDAAEFTDSLTTVLGALIAERLALVETNAPSLTYKQTLLEYLSIYDGLAKFLGGSVMESFGIAPSYSAVGVGVRTTAEAMAIATAITPKFVAIATVPESLVLADDEVLKAIFYPIISEEITFDLGVIEPSGGFTTWTVNTRTGATTEYQNYEFNSFAQSGHRYLGASSSGLYVLDGDSDDGSPTVATLRSGYAQFGGSRFSSIKAAYLGIHGSGDVYLKIEDSTGGSSTYQVLLQNYETTKCRVGKGLRARYFAWELTTTGQDFDLDSVEFVPLVAQRRV